MKQFHPVQPCEIRKLPAEVTARAYEVYHHLYSGQTLGRLNERGGFSVGEIVAFLYARSFPKEEWEARAEEALARPNHTSPIAT